MPKALSEAYRAKIGMPILQSWGMTETSPVSFQSDRDDPLDLRVSTVGRIQPHLETKIVDIDGNTVPRGETGELCTRGYSVMLGYWGDPEATALALRDAGAAAVTIARHAGGRPWLFSEILADRPAPERDERVAEVRRFVDEVFAGSGPRGVGHLRQFWPKFRRAGALAIGEAIAQYCKKGHRVGITGELQQRTWEDQSGARRSAVGSLMFRAMDKEYPLFSS